MAADPQCVVVAQAAMTADDAAAFAAATAELGIALDLPAFRAFVDAHGEWRDLVGKKLLELTYGALHGDLGFALATSYTRTMLVARTPDHVVIGAQPGTTARSPFPEGGWPIARWSRTNPATNAPKVAAWVAAAATHAHVIVVPRIASAAAAPDADANGPALFAALCADPTDPAVRAVYADWLIERGDPRGELMRLHAERKYAELHRRGAVARAATTLGSYIRRAERDSGLVEGIEIAPADLARHARALFAQHPIHRVDLVAIDPAHLRKLARIADAPLDRVRTLALHGRPRTPIEPSALCGTRLVANLRTLRALHLADDLPEWQRFLCDLGAPHLEALTLGIVASAEIARFVAAPTTLPQLRALSLWHQPWLGHAAPAAAASAVAIVRAAVQREGLASLLISGWEPGLDATATIAELLAGAPNLADVTLAVKIDDRAVRALARGRFTRVALRGAISAAALAELIETLPLRSLEIWLDTAVDDAIIRAIEAAPPRLAHVHWSHPELTAAQAARIAATRTLEEHVVRV